MNTLEFAEGHRPMLVGLLALCVAPVVLAEAVYTRQPAGLILEWESAALNENLLANSVERLLVVLYNTKNLPLFEYTGATGRPVETILRENRLFLGAHFPVGVDSVLCDLNPTVCSRAREPAPREKLKDFGAHVGGYVPTRGRWTNSEKTESLVLPKLVFEKYTTLESVPVGSNQSIDALARRYDADCSRWRLSCEDLIKRLNPHLVYRELQLKGSLTAAVPVTGLRAQLSLVSAEASSVASAVSAIDQLRAEPHTSVQVPSGLQFAPRWTEQVQGIVVLDAGVKALRSNISSVGKARANSADVETRFAEQRPLFSLIKHPYSKKDVLAAELTRPIAVAVFDTWLDKDHCYLPDQIHVFSQPNQRPPPVSAAQCGDEATAPDFIKDHGTHVVGLIAASRNAKGLIGLNPFAKLIFRQIERGQMAVPNYRRAVARDLSEISILHDARVFNLSWDYKNQVGDADEIAKMMLVGLGYTSLIVTAAGNSRTNFDEHVCDQRPACLSEGKNVITVVGLNRDEGHPTLWTTADQSEGSNSSQRFHIAAIADQVLSTASGNFVGRMSGTSQAAPQVTAAASLIYSVYDSKFRTIVPELLPSRVKNRLIYTSDIFPSLLPHVFGGRLNVDRAVNVGNEILVVKDDNGGRRELVGRVTRFGNEPAFQHIRCRSSVGLETDVLKTDLRRMYFDEGTNRYITYRNQIKDDRHSPLLRDTDCALLTRSHKGEFETLEGETVSFEFRQVRDYVSAMF